MSRIRLREAIAKGLLPARRDNAGHLRVDLGSVPSDLDARLARNALGPAELLDTLFDEIEELQAHLVDKDAQIGQLKTLVKRQDDALERSLKALGEVVDEQKAEARKRALADAPGKTPDCAGDDREHDQRFRELVDRAMSLVEAAETASGERQEALTVAAGRAMDLLERALAEGEARGIATGKLSEMLDRALDHGQRLEAEVREKSETVRRQEQVVRKMIGMSERALEVADRSQSARRRWLGWLVGR